MIRSRLRHGAALASRLAGEAAVRSPGLVRRKFLTDPFLYRVYFRVASRNSRTLPTRRDDVYIDGYPRSANTFTVNLVRHFFPDVKMAHHLHTAAGLKLAVGASLPAIVLIRAPGDAIASYAYRRHHRPDQQDEITDSLLDRLIQDYVLFYETCVDLRDRIRFVRFETMTSAPLDVLKRELPPSLLARSVYALEQEELDRFTASFRAGNKKKLETKAGTNSMPAPETAGEKRSYVNRLEQRPQFQTAVRLYEQLVEAAA